MINDIKKQQGSITLIMVFVTTMVLFLFVYSDHVNAMKEKLVSRNDVETEQAFYSAQSCLEEGYYQLRINKEYTGDDLEYQQINCHVATEYELGATEGVLNGIGEFNNKERVITSVYFDAGPSESRNDLAIYHILDRSGSMGDDGSGCTNTDYTNVTDCQNNGGVWGIQPMTSAQAAAKLFIDSLDSDHDEIGIVSYSDSVNLEMSATNIFNNAKQAIDDMVHPSGYTNIGDAISVAATQLAALPEEEIKAEILLTDGQANRPTGVNAEEYAVAKATEAKENGVIIFSIGLGDDVNNVFLNEIASEIDGEKVYFYAPSADELEAIYNKIAGIIISYNIRQGTWQEE